MRRRLAPVAVGAALLLGACLPGDAGGPDETGRSSSSSASATPAAEGDTFDEPHRRELTQEQIDRALPTIDDAPEGYGINDSTVSSGWEYEPKRCAAVEFSTPTAKDFGKKHHGVGGEARYSRPEVRGGGFLGVWIDSYDKPYPLALFDEAGEELSHCAEFEQTSDSGYRMVTETTAITAPQVDGADRVFTLRIDADNNTIDRLYVRSGHNRILVTQMTPKGRPFDERLLTKHAEAVLADLKKDS